MATRKREVIVIKLEATECIEVYADADAEGVIAQVEGVLRVFSAPGWSHYVILDPRYDINEVAADIESAILEAAQARARATVAEAERILAKEPAP